MKQEQWCLLPGYTFREEKQHSIWEMVAAGRTCASARAFSDALRLWAGPRWPLHQPCWVSASAALARLKTHLGSLRISSMALNAASARGLSMLSMLSTCMPLSTIYNPTQTPYSNPWILDCGRRRADTSTTACSGMASLEHVVRYI